MQKLNQNYNIDELVKKVELAELYASDQEDKVDKLQDEVWDMNWGLKIIRDKIDWLLDGKDDGLDITEEDVQTIREQVDKLIKFQR